MSSSNMSHWIRHHHHHQQPARHKAVKSQRTVTRVSTQRTTTRTSKKVRVRGGDSDDHEYMQRIAEIRQYIQSVINSLPGNVPIVQEITPYEPFPETQWFNHLIVSLVKPRINSDDFIEATRHDEDAPMYGLIEPMLLRLTTEPKRICATIYAILRYYVDVSEVADLDTAVRDLATVLIKQSTDSMDTEAAQFRLRHFFNAFEHYRDHDLEAYIRAFSWLSLDQLQEV